MKISTNFKTALVVVILVGLWFIGMGQYALWQQRGKERAEAGAREAVLDQSYLAAQAAVKRVIKSPASAVFPPRSECVLIGAYNFGTWTGYFDAQNTYGAMVRGYFKVYAWQSAVAEISDQPIKPTENDPGMPLVTRP